MYICICCKNKSEVLLGIWLLGATFWVRIAKPSGPHCTDAFGGKHIVECRPLLGALPLSLILGGQAARRPTSHRKLFATVVGWSNNHFNKLHFNISLETNKSLITCFKHTITTSYFVILWNAGC